MDAMGPSLLQTTEAERDRGRGRARELETGRLVERAVVARVQGVSGSAFLARRAAADVDALDAGSARRSLSRAVSSVAAEVVDPGSARTALICWGGVLERHGERAAAVSAFEAALAVEPAEPHAMLHAARAHRKAGNRDAALALYGRVRERGNDRMARFSALGEALLSDAPERALGEVLDDASAAGDREAAAVALEERARLRRAAGRPTEAVEDFAAAALRYDDRRDRVRVAHSLADLLLARGDLDAAREALGAALDLALPEERDHAIQRLRELARAQHDEVGLRRWRATGRPASLVSLMPPRAPAPPTLASAIRAWREILSAD